MPYLPQLIGAATKQQQRGQSQSNWLAIQPTKSQTPTDTAQPNLESGWNLSFDFESVVKSYENMPGLL